MVAGGAEKASTPLGVGGFGAARIISTRNDNPQAASRPWDKDRDGFVLATAREVLVLRSTNIAENAVRNLTLKLSFCMSSDAYHMTSLPETAQAQPGNGKCLHGGIEAESDWLR